MSPCIGRWILIHCACREVWVFVFVERANGYWVALYAGLCARQWWDIAVTETRPDSALTGLSVQ